MYDAIQVMVLSQKITIHCVPCFFNKIKQSKDEKEKDSQTKQDIYKWKSSHSESRDITIESRFYRIKQTDHNRLFCHKYLYTGVYFLRAKGQVRYIETWWEMGKTFQFIFKF